MAEIICVASREEKSVCRQASSLRPGSCAAFAGPIAASRTAAIVPLSDGAAATSSALFSHRSLMGSGVIVTGSLAAAGAIPLSLTVTADLCAGLPPLCVYEATDATSASRAARRIRRSAARTVTAPEIVQTPGK